MQGQLGSQAYPGAIVPPVAAALPRDPSEFVTGAFGPLTPIVPIGVDVPPPGEERPEPRRWQYPVGWNLPVGVPRSEGLTLTTFSNLRALADSYSVARSCINIRVNEILGLEWDIGPTHAAEKTMRDDRAAYREFNERKAKLVSFFHRPDPNYLSYQSWLRALLEDIFVIDAVALYVHPSRKKGKGVLGSNLAGLDLLDGTTIRPLVDLSGATPPPPNVAYQQYLWGVPRSDLLSMFLQTDISDMTEAQVGQYRGDQLLYLRYFPRDWTVYGFPLVEQALVPLLAGLAKQQYAMQWFSEGTIPGMFLDPGPEITTPQQIAALQHALNSIAGDIGFKHKIIVLPSGARPQQMKPTALADQFDQLVQTWTMMVFEVQPMELGMLPGRHAGSGTGGSATATGTGTGAAAIQAAIQNRKSVKPLLMFLKRELFDLIIQDHIGAWDMEWKWKGMDESPVDPEKRAQELQTYWSFGALSLDEVRDAIGRPPWGTTLSSDPVYAGSQLMPMGSVPYQLEQEVERMPDSVVPPPPPGTSLVVGPAGETVDEAEASASQTPPSTSQTSALPTVPPRVPSPQTSTGAYIQQTPAHETAVIPTAAMRPQRKLLEADRTWSPTAHSLALTELEKAARIVKKGRALADFIPEHIPADIWEKVLEAAQTIDDPAAGTLALEWGADLLRAQAHVARREAKVAAHMREFAAPVAKLFKTYRRRKLNPYQLQLQAEQLLKTHVLALLDEGLADGATATNQKLDLAALRGPIAEKLDFTLSWLDATGAPKITETETQAESLLRAAYEAGFFATNAVQE